jgi:hypothetical protein
MANDPRYTAVEAALPAALPPITREEALRAYRKLVRHFGSVKDLPVGVAEARGGRPIRTFRERARRVWIAPKPTTGHHRGWGRLIHDASHTVFERRHPHARAHDGGHATLEREMAQYVVAKGWLAGSLKPPVKAKPTISDQLKALQYRIDKWQTKARRASTALKKLHNTKKRLLKKLEAVQ